MYQVRPYHSSSQKVVLPSSTEGAAREFIHMRSHGDEFRELSTLNSLPTPITQPPAKQRKISRSVKRKGVIAIVPPPSSAPAAGVPPQTPPPSASRIYKRTDLQLPETPKARASSGSKTVPNAFVTPQSASPSKNREESILAKNTWSSSSPIEELEENGLRISVRPSTEARDVDPTLIYPDGYHGRKAQSATKYNSYTTLFSSPIQYPPYLGKRSLSNFALSSDSMYGGTRESKSVNMHTSGSHPSSDDACSPLTPASTTVFFEISETGQAVIARRQSSPVIPGSRQRVLSSSSSFSSVSSSSDSLSMLSDDNGDDTGISEAETEIFASQPGTRGHGDALLAMAKTIQRQQIQLQRENAIRTRTEKRRIREERHRLRRHKRHASSGDAVSMAFGTASVELETSLSLPGKSISSRLESQGSPLERADQDSHSHMHRLAIMQRQQKEEQRQLQEQHQAQQQHLMMESHRSLTHTQSELFEKQTDPAAHNRPSKGQYTHQQQHLHVESDDGVTRCVCGTVEWLGEPMIQCDSCECWLHMGCVRVDPHRRIIGAWYCPICMGAVPHH